MGKKEEELEESTDGAVFESWTLIKWNPTAQAMTLAWEERMPGNPETDQVRKVWHNPPKSAFTDALKELREFVADFLGITGAEKKKLAEQLEVRGVKYKPDKHGRKAQFIVVRKIPDGVRINIMASDTPWFYVWLEDDESGLPEWTPACIDTLERLQDAAMAYSEGDFEPLSELTGRPISEDGPLFGDGESDTAA